MIYWYYCNRCLKEFSHVFTGGNDAERCVSCRSNNIRRIVKTRKLKGIYY
jgi:DNA-directed RNA polymerase subunit RPC12/RpoP